MQLSFDIFDANSDGKISQLDVFKVLRVFDQGPLSEDFGNVMYKDVCLMSKMITQHLSINKQDHLLRNDSDVLFTKR